MNISFVFICILLFSVVFALETQSLCYYSIFTDDVPSSLSPSGIPNLYIGDCDLILPNDVQSSIVERVRMDQHVDLEKFEIGELRQIGDSNPLFDEQWAWTESTAGNRSPDAWDMGATGKGVTVLVIDDGCLSTHPDIAARFNLNISRNFETNVNDPTPSDDSDDHGTSVAGIIASANDGVCIIGTAYEAEVGARRLLYEESTLQDVVNSYKDFSPATIISNSWGYITCDGDGCWFIDDSEATNSALKAASATALVVFAAGNSRSNGGHTSYDPIIRQPEVIAVGAVNREGTYSYYSTPGPSVYISAGSSGYYNNRYIGIPSISIETQCTSDFGGTSAACPQVSGVVALMMGEADVKPRDCELILALTARDVDSGSSSWVENAAGVRHSEDYGLGMVDAGAAVTESKLWNGPGPAKEEITDGMFRLDLDLPDDSNVTEKVVFPVEDNGIIVERVAVRITGFSTFSGDVEITLKSPSGTSITLLPKRANDGEDDVPQGWISAVSFYGERSGGDWTVGIRDCYEDDRTTISSVEIRVIGWRPLWDLYMVQGEVVSDDYNDVSWVSNSDKHLDLYIASVDLSQYSLLEEDVDTGLEAASVFIPSDEVLGFSGTVLIATETGVDLRPRFLHPLQGYYGDDNRTSGVLGHTKVSFMLLLVLVAIALLA